MRTMEGIGMATAVLAAGPLVITGCGEGAPHPSFNSLVKDCTTPASFSPIYPGNPNAHSDHSDWSWVLIGANGLLEGATVKVGYGSPDTVSKLPHPSQEIQPDENVRDKGILVSIGKGAVQYWVTATYRNVASEEGRFACDQIPPMDYPPTPQPQKPSDGIEPKGW